MASKVYELIENATQRHAVGSVWLDVREPPITGALLEVADDWVQILYGGRRRWVRISAIVMAEIAAPE